MSRVAVVTIVHGRHEHLTAQLASLRRSIEPPDDHVVVTMNDPDVAALPEFGGKTDLTVIACDSAATDGARPLPLARARNQGAEAALARGAEVLVFLDVDCLAAPQTVRAYRDAALRPATTGHLLCGPVTYLDPRPSGGYPLDALAALDRPHPARPAPRPGEVVLGGPHELFWSLSFALHARTWRRIGGFCEDYTGYGGEDTDFAFTARSAGIDLAWIGDARAYHQHHPVQNPPVGHLDDIVRNAQLFHERWGVWPMIGWLDAFERQGLIHRTPETVELTIDPSGLVAETAS